MFHLIFFVCCVSAGPSLSIYWKVYRQKQFVSFPRFRQLHRLTQLRGHWHNVVLFDHIICDASHVAQCYIFANSCFVCLFVYALIYENSFAIVQYTVQDIINIIKHTYMYIILFMYSYCFRAK